MLDPAARSGRGCWRGVRVVDTVLSLGAPAGEWAPGRTASVLAATADRGSRTVASDLVTYQLLDTGSTLTRYLGTGLAESPLSDLG